MKDARAAGRNIYAWTVNDEQTMRYTKFSTAFPKLLSAGIQLKLTGVGLLGGRFVKKSMVIFFSFFFSLLSPFNCLFRDYDLTIT